MTYNIRLGVPEMAEFWNGLREKIANGAANKDERATYKKITLSDMEPTTN